MIFAIDIETIGNPNAVTQMPEPKPNKRLKDPAKIADDIAEKKAAMEAEAALDPLTARVACVAAVGLMGDGKLAEYVESIVEANDSGERAVLQSIMRMLGGENVRIATWNGIGFDLPMIYYRAMILGVDPGSFGAPPLSAWTKRYSTDRHYDLMQIWLGWSSRNKDKSWESPASALNLVASVVLGERKVEFDVATIAALLDTEAGRKQVEDYCLQDTRLTWRLWERMNGTMFV